MAETEPSGIILLDNGADTIKVGCLEDTLPRVHVNGLARVRWTAPGPTSSAVDGAGAKPGPRVVCGAALDQLSPLGLQVRRPFDRGLVNDFPLEARIWKGVLAQEKLSLAGSRLVLTVPPLCPRPVVERLLKMAFYHFHVKAVHLTNAAYAALWYHETHREETAAVVSTLTNWNGTGIVVDAGHSASHVVPVLGGGVLHAAVRRLDIGGRILSNYLKELISYRSWNVMKESYLVHRLKERVCYVCMDLKQELERSRKHPETTMLHYILPDETDRGDDRWGSVCSMPTPTEPSDAVTTDDRRTSLLTGSESTRFTLTFTNEHFLVPESLFSPQDTIQAPQCGLAELVVQSLEHIPSALWPPLLQDIVLIGGNVRTKGFAERFLRELKSLTPALMPLRVWVGRHQVGHEPLSSMDDSSDPGYAGWFGLQALTRCRSSDAEEQFWLTREVFERDGLSAIERRWIHLGLCEASGKRLKSTMP
jgi:actin-related protein 6